ncbi:subtilase family protein [Actinidia rufa]|uniref:Subtilase family protein n=1 Tax=Actinidia rufa TaxID=165716 RepID=A0A7J0H5Y2_9ERIC|nr:subtilase family protein [Actinidia rufa]
MLFSNLHFFLALFILPATFFQTPAFAVKKPYIVYMGVHSHGPELLVDSSSQEASHLEFLASFLGSTEKAEEAIFQSYTKEINGFAVHLEEEAAAEISSVWPESESFSDKGYGAVPSKWKGFCQNETSLSFPCNRKLIGARYFYKGYIAIGGNTSSPSPRDFEGHGTHTLSTAGGNIVPVGGKVFPAHISDGVLNVKGGSPKARVASYKVCWYAPGDKNNGCFYVDMLEAINAAIHDGVNVISMSMGVEDVSDYFNDAVAIGSFHAVKKGIVVVAAAGNSGPADGTVTNAAPWLITVGAATMDRQFESVVQLANGLSFKGASLSGPLSNNTFYKLITGAQAKAANVSDTKAAKFRVTGESPECHRSKLSNSEQIQSAQNRRLSIPQDSSLRYEAPAPNGFQIGVQTSPHAPFEVRRIRSTRPTRARGRRRLEFTRHAPPRARKVTHAPAHSTDGSRALARAPTRQASGGQSQPAPARACTRQESGGNAQARAPRAQTAQASRASRSAKPSRAEPSRAARPKESDFDKKALSEFSRHSGFIREVGFRRFCFHFGEVRRRSNLRALIMLSDADYAPGKPRMRNEMNRKMIGQIRQCIGHEHDEMSAHGLWTKLKEMYREKTSQNKVLLRRLVLKLQRGTIVAEQTSEFQREPQEEVKRRGQRRESRGRTLSAFIATRRDKKNCLRNKAQNQSSEAATTAMMAVDESDVLLAASADEESDWISDSGIVYHLCRDREVFSTHVACEGLVRMANDAIVGKGHGGTLRVSKRNRRSCKRRKTGRLYRLRENVQTGELLSDIGPVVLARWMDEEATVAQRHAKQAQEYLMDDVHEEAQRRETESMHNDRRDVAETSLFRSRSVAVISPVVHTKGGEMESRRLAKRRTLQSTPVRGSRAPKSCQEEAPKELKTEGAPSLLHGQQWMLYELSHELICSSLWPINSEDRQRREEAGAEKCKGLGALMGAHSRMLCAKGLGERGLLWCFESTESREGCELCWRYGDGSRKDELTSNELLALPFEIPSSNINYRDGLALIAYTNSTVDPRGSLTAPKAQFGTKPAPSVPSFSSRGPNPITPEILKPDIVAPGVGVIAAYSEAQYIGENQTIPYMTLDGTSWLVLMFPESLPFLRNSILTGVLQP